MIEKLRESLARRAPATVHDDVAQRAAVAVVVAGGPQPAILFVKRKVRSGDPWSGQMAFPGGYASPEDPSPADTAERETHEEAGLDLAAVGERLGMLDDVHPRIVHLPRIVVTPCVFALPARSPVSPGAEVDAAVWIGLSDLFDGRNRRPYEVVLSSGPMTFESILVDGYMIWGLTEGVLAQLAQTLDSR